MKKPVVIITILIAIFFYGLYYIYDRNPHFVRELHPGNLTIDSIKNNYTGLYEIDSVPTNLDSNNFSISIKLDPDKKRHILLMPNGGTETSIIITDTLYHVHSNSDKKIYAEESFYSYEDPLIDISNLKKGKYRVHFLSCSIGGMFSLTIK